MQKDIDPRSLISPKQRRAILLSVLAASIVLADELTKYYALHHFPFEEALVGVNVLALAIHKNFGIAFDIPFKLPIVLIMSFPFLALLGYTAVKKWGKRPDTSLALSLIVIGALGNIYDRIMYGFTVDYIILFGRTAINMSDVVIILGVLTLLFVSRRKRRRPDDEIL